MTVSGDFDTDVDSACDNIHVMNVSNIDFDKDCILESRVTAHKCHVKS